MQNTIKIGKAPKDRVIFMIWMKESSLHSQRSKEISSHSIPWATTWLMTASLPCLRMRLGGMKGVRCDTVGCWAEGR